MKKILVDALDALPTHLTTPLFYRHQTGHWPSLIGPRTFSDKLQRAKLRPVDAHMIRMVDKAAVKQVVLEILGEDWVVPTIYTGPSLPSRNTINSWPRPFIIKATHGSGWSIPVRSDDRPNWDEVESEVDRWLRAKRRRFVGELAYRHVRPAVIVEPMISGDDLPRDFKVFVFHGRAQFVQVDLDRDTEHTRAFYDRNWTRLPFTIKRPQFKEEVPAPYNLGAILDAAETVAKGGEFLRVDFYEVGERPYFGEATYFPGSGMEPFYPAEYDRVVGDLW